MELIDNWKQAPKMWSVIAATLLAGFDTLHGLLPALQSVVSPATFTWINAASAIGIVMLRIVKQSSVTGTEAGAPPPAPPMP